MRSRRRDRILAAVAMCAGALAGATALVVAAALLVRLFRAVAGV